MVIITVSSFYKYNETTERYHCNECIKSYPSANGVGLHVAQWCEASKEKYGKEELKKRMTQERTIRSNKNQSSKPAKVSPIIVSSFYKYNETTERYHCNECPKKCHTANGIGLHVGTYCEASKKKYGAQELKRRMKREKNSRNKKTPLGRETKRRDAAKQNRKPEVKLAKKIHAQKPESKKKRLIWEQSPAGQLSRRKAMDRFLKAHPERLKQFYAKSKLLGRTSHRYQKPKRLNKFMLSQVDKDFKVQREHAISEAEAPTKKLKQMFKKLVDLLSGTYSDEDSTVFNYLYLYADVTLWTDDMTFAEFVDSIFYIGRGIGTRFLDHARDTKILLDEGIEIDSEKKPKEAKIEELWYADVPVKVIMLNMGKYAEKTDAVEFATTFTKGKYGTNKDDPSKNLTNKQYDGAASIPLGFSVDQVFALGTYYLRQAFESMGDKKKTFELTRDFDYGKTPATFYN